MPIFFELEVDSVTRFAIWRIEEPEDFFIAKVTLQRSITHPHKRLQHLAGRYLLQHLFPDFPTELIQLADTRKPFLADEAYHFSISHCGDFAAAIVSANRRVGIDVELLSDKVQRIRHKFISEGEERILNTQYSILKSHVDAQIGAATLLWSCKEAIFKWYGAGNVDFRADMQLQQLETVAEKEYRTTFLFKKNGDHTVSLHSKFFDALCLSYIIT